MLGLAAALLVAAVVALVFEPWLRARVNAEAAAHGALIGFRDYTLRWRELTLHDVSVERAGTLRVRGKAERITIELAGLTPRALHADAAELEVEGPLRAALHPTAPTAPAPALRLTRLSLEWRELHGADPWLVVRAGSWATTPRGGDGAGHVSLFGTSLGHATASWSRADQRASAGLWLEGLPPRSERFPAPTLAVELLGAGDALELRARLHEAPLEALLRRLDPRATTQFAVASGSLELRSLPTGSTSGKLALSLARFVPPRPEALRDLALGAGTAIESELTVSSDLRQVELAPLELRAGALELRGQGALTRDHGALEARAHLRGTIGCDALAAAAAAPGSPLAGRGVGSGEPAPVVLAVELDLRELGRTRVRHELGEGCGLSRRASGSVLGQAQIVEP